MQELSLHHDRSLRSAALCLCALVAIPLAAQAQLGSSALVYRDVHGIPHIEASTEEDAWYALGYEGARDNLFNIQANIARFRGVSAKLLGDGPIVPGVGERTNIQNDMLVQYYKTNLQVRFNGDLAQLQAMLEDTTQPPGKEDQLFDNLTAYAAGIESYREHFRDGPLDGQEQEYKDWIDDQNYEWAYDNPAQDVTVFDVASWGPWMKIGPNWALASFNDNNPHGVSCLPPPPSGSSVAEVPTDPVDIAHSILRLRPGSGSNGIAFSYDYLKDASGVQYTGCMADPHGGVNVTFAYENPSSSGADHIQNTVQFAQIVVAGTRLNAFGYVHHGSGVFFTAHNQHVAVGGSAAGPNISDAFLLRLREESDFGGEAGVPWVNPSTGTYQYYSFYDDLNQNNGVGDDAPWLDLGQDQIIIDRIDGTQCVIDVLQAGKFGTIFHTTPFYGDRSADWIFGDVPNVFTPTAVVNPDTGETSIPVLVSYRMPQDPAVDGASHHDRFAVAMYRIMSTLR